MNIPDVIFAVGGATFAVALLPAFFDDSPPPLMMSALTGGVLLVYAGTYFVLGLPQAAGMNGALGLMWLGLAARALRRRMR